MTICAAILCKLGGRQDAIFCISDRLITWDGLIEQETEHQTKAWGLSPAKAIALFSGDVREHDEIVRKTHERIIKDGITDVQQGARLYCDNLKAVEKRIKGRKQLKDEDLGVNAIIAGFDSGGGHLYRIKSLAGPTCEDSIGWGAVGSGEWLFDLHFKVSDYSRFWEAHKALLLLYEAKKKAESASGVGEVTDIFRVDKDVSLSGRKPMTANALKKYYREIEETLEKKRMEIVKRMKQDGKIIERGK